MKLSLETFGDLQSWQEKLHIPFTTSMKGMAVAILNHFSLEGEPSIEIEFSDDILQEVPSYIKNPSTWANNIKNVHYNHVTGFRRHNKSVLVASNGEVLGKGWFKNLIATLQNETSVTYDFSEMTLSYVQNPYMLLRRLRPKFPTIQITKDTILDTITFTK